MILFGNKNEMMRTDMVIPYIHSDVQGPQDSKAKPKTFCKLKKLTQSNRKFLKSLGFNPKQ